MLFSYMLTRVRFTAVDDSDVWAGATAPVNSELPAGTAATCSSPLRVARARVRRGRVVCGTMAHLDVAVFHKTFIDQTILGRRRVGLGAHTLQYRRRFD